MMSSRSQPVTEHASDEAATQTAAPSAPVRVQLSRAKGWRMPPNTMKVDRTSCWGNPFKLADVDGDSARAVAAFRSWAGTEAYLQAARRVLGGKNLACWCRLDAPCHADVLLELANRDRSQDGTTGRE